MRTILAKRSTISSTAILNSPPRGTWGLQGIIQIPERAQDYVFFVTFGQKQAEHEFDEGITADGVLRWQSQPKQRLNDSSIRNLVRHDEDQNSIYLFLRTSDWRKGSVVPYTYLGRLKYLVHDHDREQPVYFTWQILEGTFQSMFVTAFNLHMKAWPWSNKREPPKHKEMMD